MRFVFPAPATPAIPIEGTDGFFPVRRIWCMGRNYAEHAREMGAEASRASTFFFAKPADAVVPLGGALPYPSATNDLHHEVELAVVLSGGGTNIPVEEASRLIFGCAIALDMTRRDLQAEFKRMAWPWDMGKGFDQSCPISAIRPTSGTEAAFTGEIELAVNGEVRQRGELSDMIWSVPECIAALSRLVRIEPGDVLLTGTPAGVGPVVIGDVLEARCAVTPSLRVEYQAASVVGERDARRV